MIKILVALSLLAVGLVGCTTVPEQAGGKLFWQSPQPTGQVLGKWGTKDCYATIRVLEKLPAQTAIYAGKSVVFYNPNECPSSPDDIVLPSDAQVLKARGMQDALKMRKNSDGSVEFYYDKK